MREAQALLLLALQKSDDPRSTDWVEVKRILESACCAAMRALATKVAG